MSNPSPPTLSKRRGRNLSRVGSLNYLRSCMDRDIRHRSNPDEPATSRGGLKMTKRTYSMPQYDCPGRPGRNIALFGGGRTRTSHEAINLIQHTSLHTTPDHRVKVRATEYNNRWFQQSFMMGLHTYYSTYKHSHKKRHRAIWRSKGIFDVRFRTRPRCW